MDFIILKAMSFRNYASVACEGISCTLDEFLEVNSAGNVPIIKLTFLSLLFNLQNASAMKLPILPNSLFYWRS